MLTIEQELRNATGYANRLPDNPEEERRQLIRAADRLSDAKFNSLSFHAAKWLNAGVKAIKDKKPIPEYEQFLAPTTPAPPVNIRPMTLPAFEFIDPPEASASLIVPLNIELARAMGIKVSEQPKDVQFHLTVRRVKVVPKVKDEQAGTV